MAITTSPAAVTTDIDPTSGADSIAAPATGGAGYLTTALATGRRTILQFFRTPNC